jgi:hypothetical protein
MFHKKQAEDDLVHQVSFVYWKLNEPTRKRISFLEDYVVTLHERLKALEGGQTYSYDQIDHTPEYERAWPHGIIVFESNGHPRFIPLYPDPVIHPQVSPTFR